MSLTTIILRSMESHRTFCRLDFTEPEDDRLDARKIDGKFHANREHLCFRRLDGLLKRHSSNVSDGRDVPAKQEEDRKPGLACVQAECGTSRQLSDFR
jgi:hypothetical protein